MRINYSKSWISNATENELRAASNKIRAALDDEEYCSKEYNRLSDLNTDIINEIVTRFSYDMPHREHGWYLSNDD